MQTWICLLVYLSHTYEIFYIDLDIYKGINYLSSKEKHQPKKDRKYFLDRQNLHQKQSSKRVLVGYKNGFELIYYLTWVIRLQW